jgi:hypothetical protein
MFPLVIFASLLVVMVLMVDPNMLLCATTLSTGLASGVPNQWYALSLLLLFVALRSRIAGFVLLIPSFVSAAMAPEAAVAIGIASIVLLMRRYLDWMVFVLIAASIALVLLVGLPLAVLVVLALLIPILADIPSSVWRIRAIALWFALWFAASLSLSYYTGLFAFDLVGVSIVPIPLVVFAAFAIQSFIVLGNDSHAALSRSILLFASAFLFAELAVFAIPLIIAIMAVHLERSIGEERLRGSRIVALFIVVFALVVSFEPSSEPIDVERAIVFAPDYLELACEGRAYPDRLSTWRDLAYLSSIDDPNRIVGELAQREVSEVVYASGFDEPIVFALTYANASFEERDGFIVASFS